MFGSGVIGTIYGHAFSQSGIDVVHYVRPNKLEQLNDGIQLHLLDGRRKTGIHIQNYKPNLVDELPSFDEFDLVIVSLRHYQLKSVLPLLAKNLGRADILFFNHLWTDTSVIDEFLPQDKYIWGFPSAGGGFYQMPNLILKGALMDFIYLGEMNGKNSERIMSISKLFEQVGIKVKVQKNMQHWLWKQFSLNAGISTVAMKAGGTEKLMSSIPYIRLAVLCIREALIVSKARGVNVKQFFDARVFFLPSWIAALAFWATLKTNRYQSEIFKYYNHAEEIQRIYDDVMDMGKELKVKMPILDSMANDIKQSSNVLVKNKIS